MAAHHPVGAALEAAQARANEAAYLANILERLRTYRGRRCTEETKPTTRARTDACLIKRRMPRASSPHPPSPSLLTTSPPSPPLPLLPPPLPPPPPLPSPSDSPHPPLPPPPPSLPCEVYEEHLRGQFSEAGACAPEPGSRVDQRLEPAQHRCAPVPGNFVVGNVAKVHASR